MEVAKVNHFSFFTGIGGLDMAAERAGFKTVGQCEFADYPTKILEKHWPDVPRWRDIRDVTADAIRDRGIRQVDIISGGFPCQPHSLAGKREASGDERDLWGELARVIYEIKPRWVVAENVRGLLSSEDGRFFGRVLNDLARMGFNVGWGLYGADNVGALHQRKRIFIVAYSGGKPGTQPLLNRDGKEATKRHQEKEERRTDWQQFKVGTEVDTGISGGWGQLDKPRLVRVASRTSERVDEIRGRLTVLGNMVVPQQAYPIFKAIMDIEQGVII